MENVNDSSTDTVIVTSASDVKEELETASVEESDVEENSESENEESEEESTEEESEESDDDSKEDESENEETEEEKKPKKKGGFKKRIERYERKISQKDAEIESLRKQLNGQKEGSIEKISDAFEGLKKPIADDFETHEEFVEAMAEYKYEQRSLKDKETQKAQEIRSEMARKANGLVEKINAFKAQVSDFDEVVDDVEDIVISASVQDAILSSEIGPQLMYELASDREYYEKICNMPPLQAAREIGKFEAKISLKYSQETKKETKPKTTKAPAPIKAVSGNSTGGASKSIYDRGLTQREYERLRDEQEKRGY